MAAKRPKKKREYKPREVGHLITPEMRAKFLEVLRAGLSVAAASQAAGVQMRNFYDLRSSDEQFAEDWKDAYEAGTDRLEDEVVKLGVKSGNVVALIFMLKGRRPDKYREGNVVNVQSAQIAFVNAMQRLEAPEARGFIVKELKDDRGSRAQ